MERDRLKAKLEALRQDHKRKVMIKILGRLGNMQYFVAWSHWYNATVRMHQFEVEKKIRDLRAELKDYETKTAEMESEAQRRADEAAKMSLGAASDSQRKLILKIMTKLTQGLARMGFNQWHAQAFGAKLQKQLMKKIIKRLYNAQLNKGFIAWKTITQKWNLFAKLELKEKLIAELADLEAKAKEYKLGAEQRQEDAAAAALARATGAQKDLATAVAASGAERSSPAILDRVKMAMVPFCMALLAVIAPLGAVGLAPRPSAEPRASASCARRDALLGGMPLVAAALGGVPLAALADGEESTLGEGELGSTTAMPFTTPLPAREKRGVFKCYEERDGKVIDVCKEQRIAEKAAAPPVKRNVERDVDMKEINRVLAEQKLKKSQIVLRETPEWLKSTRDD